MTSRTFAHVSLLRVLVLALRSHAELFRTMQVRMRAARAPVFHYKSAPLKRRPPANIYREDISPRRLHTGKMSPPGDISHGKNSPVGGKIIRPLHVESAYTIIISPTPCKSRPLTTTLLNSFPADTYDQYTSPHY